MSRIGKAPVELPGNVEVNIGNGEITIKGPLGVLKRMLSPHVTVDMVEKELRISPVGNSHAADAMSGTTRALLANMVTGVTKGFERKLLLVGVGYRAQAQGDKLNLTLGFSHPVVHPMPVGIETPTQTEILIKGIDKQVVGQIAAEVRAYRSPEPYKGKGVRYSDETVVLKETKKK